MINKIKLKWIIEMIEQYQSEVSRVKKFKKKTQNKTVQ